MGWSPGLLESVFPREHWLLHLPPLSGWEPLFWAKIMACKKHERTLENHIAEFAGFKMPQPKQASMSSVDCGTELPLKGFAMPMPGNVFVQILAGCHEDAALTARFKGNPGKVLAVWGLNPRRRPRNHGP